MRLADERIQRASVALLRLAAGAAQSADMWLRPRTEMLPLDSRWWEYSDDLQDCVIATMWGVLNLLFIAAA